MVKKLNHPTYRPLILIWGGLSLFTPLTHALEKTATLNLIATIVPACTAGTEAGASPTFGTLDFGSHSLLAQPLSVTGQAHSGALLIHCAANTAYQVRLNGGNSGTPHQRHLLGIGHNQRIQYNLYTTGAHSTIWDNVVGVRKTATGMEEWLPVYGHIPAQTTPVMDSYQDSVTVTVSW